MKLGIDVLLSDPKLKNRLKGKRVSLLGHPASVTSSMEHSLDALMKIPEIKITSAFGPQHGMKGDKQDNMKETPDDFDPAYKIPIYSLYGKVRRPTPEMMDSFDVILIDLQDIGCRIYTFITTLLYILEECAKKNKEVWILDRPNPAGRPIEGLLLKNGFESFVGSGPMPMRHGLTMGEMANWFVSHFKLNIQPTVIKMENYFPNQGPGFGWPLGELSWINPSPNVPIFSVARIYSGSVMLEGTHISEGRGTTRPFECIGAPDIDAKKVLKEMFSLAPHWLEGCRIRECYFEPTFNKHSGKLCNGLQFHVDDPAYAHDKFKPFRAFSLFFKAIRNIYPEYQIWRDFPYEYITDHLAIDAINGSKLLREWVDRQTSTIEEFEQLLRDDEKTWKISREPFLLY